MQEQEARMPPSKRTSSVLNGDDGDNSRDSAGDSAESAGPDDALALAEEAEAEAAEAEAVAAAARARARALRLRREAAATAAKDTAEDTDAEETEAEAAEPAAAEAEESVIEDYEAAAEGDGEESEPRRRRRLRVPRISLAVVAGTLVVLLTLGFLGVGGYMMWQHRKVVAEQQRSAEFAAGARQGVVTLMSLDFNRAADDVKRILENTTGDFRKDFESQAEDFTKVAQESKVVTEATVNAVAVRSMTQDTANVLLAVTTRVSNEQSQQQEPRSWRLSVDVARDGGQIKIAKVEFVP
jgi:Mce-associated membrane protein